MPFSTVFIFSYLKHLIRNSLSAATTVVDTPVVSYNRRLLFVVFVAFLHSYDYGVIQFWLNYLILSIILSNTISTGFDSITANQVCLYFVLEWNLCLRFHCFKLFGLNKVTLWVLLAIICSIYHWIFQAFYAKSILCWHCYSSRLSYYWIGFAVSLGGWFLQKGETGIEHQCIICFLKGSEGDMVHIETVFSFRLKFHNYNKQSVLSWL